MQKAKLIVVAVATVIVLIVVLQNTELVETRILFFRITMPRAALLFGSLLVGFALGVVAAGRFFVAKKPQ